MCVFTLNVFLLGVGNALFVCISYENKFRLCYESKWHSSENVQPENQLVASLAQCAISASRAWRQMNQIENVRINWNDSSLLVRGRSI